MEMYVLLFVSYFVVLNLTELFPQKKKFNRVFPCDICGLEFDEVEVLEYLFSHLFFPSLPLFLFQIKNKVNQTIIENQGV